MRGRGFTRGTSHTSRANDPFRSRPPNTSRPPSMHVDDFVALESHHSGSNSQTQPKRPTKVRIKLLTHTLLLLFFIIMSLLKGIKKILKFSIYVL